MTDLYSDLNIPPTASSSEIKAAYRKAARKNHPDRGGEVSSFQVIQRAYDILSDPVRKERYDLGGETNDPPDPNQAAMQALLRMILNAIENISDLVHQDVKKHVEGMIAQGQQMAKQQQHSVNQQKKKYETALKRFVFKGDSTRNSLACALEDKIKAAEKQWQSLEDQIAMGEIMKGMLKDYEYLVDKGAVATDPYTTRSLYFDLGGFQR